jgi:tripartite-type tricarboxylate transporter receptor subunit TctC
MRLAALPNVPALAEFLPTYAASIFVGIVAPRDTPADIVGKLNEEINLALADAKIARRIAELGDTPLSLSSSEFAKLIGEETDKWAKVIRTAHVKAE